MSDTPVVTAGLDATQDALEADEALSERVTRENFTTTRLYCEAVKKRLLARGGA